MKKETSNSKNLVDSVSLFVTFLILAWVVFLFPETIANFHHKVIAKLLLICGIFFISTLDNEDSEKFYGDFGVGLGFLVIYLAFFQDLPEKWYIRLFFLLSFGMFGLYGVFKSLISKLREISIKKVEDSTVETKNARTDSRLFFEIVVQIVEFLAALVTILQFIGIKLIEH